MTYQSKKGQPPRTKILGAVFSASFLAFPLVLTCPTIYAQVITGTLSGTVQDNTGAVVPKATVIVRNTLSGDTRYCVVELGGVVYFCGAQLGDYSITITRRASSFHRKRYSPGSGR